MTAHEQPTELANRMAGWFFVVLGGAILCFAAAVRSTFAPDTPTFVLVLAIVGVGSIVFGVIAPRNVRASVLDAVVTFIWV
jgi:hypothetical protein